MDGGCVVRASVVRPKTPRGDGNPTMASKSAWVTDPGRQTQNPERGRKHFERELVHSPPFRSSDPKPREGTETRKRSTSLTILFSRRQTQNPERGRKPDGTELSGFYQVVVRPKTPRGDGNAYRPPHHSHATAPCPQTQNPERGRKLVRHLCLIQVQCPVVRPKTPRGDGNWTQNRTGCGRCSSRQTQNPERGRKRISPATPQPRYCSMSSDPKPREGTETHRR
ncbi:Uncharacterised protein [Mycobacterium tuberculosis]|nr:Uncharacterised protein [Mycobacterium tuberculosis]